MKHADMNLSWLHTGIQPKSSQKLVVGGVCTTLITFSLYQAKQNDNLPRLTLLQIKNITSCLSQNIDYLPHS